jgi:aspartyl/asparaginyl-tRNA synthetase
MNKKQIKELKSIIERLEKNYDLNDYVFNYMDEDELKRIEDLDELEEYLQQINEDGNITNFEVIYYTEAIKYLSENDNSLRESLELASELGYELKDLNSEILASLLITQNNEEDYNALCNDIISEAESLWD